MTTHVAPENEVPMLLPVLERFVVPRVNSLDVHRVILAELVQVQVVLLNCQELVFVWMPFSCADVTHIYRSR